MSFEILEDPTYIGFRAKGMTFEEMLANAAEALVSLMLDLQYVAPKEPNPLSAIGDDDADLLVNWLNEVFFLVDSRRLALRRFDVTRAGRNRVKGVAWGEPRGMHHESRMMVKGVSNEKLKVEQTGDGWVCEVFLVF